VQHHPQPIGALGLRRHAERDAGGLDALLGTADSLCHRRLGDEERAGDLRRGQTADGAQGERDLGGGRECRMAAQEQKGQGVVVFGPVLVAGCGRERCVGRQLRRDLVLAPSARLLAAQVIGHPAIRDRDQPAARILRDTVLGPPDGGGQQRLLHRILARVELAVAPNKHAEDLWRQPAQQVLDHGVGSHISVPAWCISGRTSTAQ
jgi:hypothetical protein